MSSNSSSSSGSARLSAGLLGALTGLGGGVVIVPLLVIAFHVDLHLAAGALLVSVIATSSGAAAAYVKEGYTNIRIGMFLEIATTIGARGRRLPCHALISTRSAVAIVFGVVLLVLRVPVRSTPSGTDRRGSRRSAGRSGFAAGRHLPDAGGRQSYHVHRVPAGVSV